MTAKRDGKRKPKKADERPKLKAETLKDLNVNKKGEEVKGGFRSACCQR